MIQFLLLQNRQGKTRLSKYYRAYTDDEKNKIENEVHRIVTTRDAKFTNFVEVNTTHSHHKTKATTKRPSSTKAKANSHTNPTTPHHHAVQAVQAHLPEVCGALLHAMR